MYHIKMQNAEGAAVLLQNAVTVKDRPKVYAWTARTEEAMQMDADKAIRYHGEIIASGTHLGEIITIVEAAQNLWQQLSGNQAGGVAALVGATAGSVGFRLNLERTPVLRVGFTVREAALAYLEAAHAALKCSADPEARQ